MRKKLNKIFFELIRIPYWKLYPGKVTKYIVDHYTKLGVKFEGMPRYIAGDISIDGSDYSKISIGQGVTISGGVSLLTHDWALDTLYEGIYKHRKEQPIGRLKAIYIDEYSFIGAGAFLMPGTRVGKCCIIGARSVVRGDIPDYSIVIGNPAIIIGDSRVYLEKKLK